MLSQLLRNKYPDAFYLNFEDTRLYDSEPSDYLRLDGGSQGAGIWVRDVRTLQRLVFYLVSNTDRLKTMFEAGSTSTIMDYLSHFEYSYLFHFVPKFSYSLRKQLINPRKVYATDLGLIHANSGSFTDDFGSLLENLIFLHLRRHWKDICYFS